MCQRTNSLTYTDNSSIHSTLPHGSLALNPSPAKVQFGTEFCYISPELCVVVVVTTFCRSLPV